MKATIDPSFWNGKRVLVTGHTGFKGAWLCLILTHLGARVTGLSLAPEEPSLYTQSQVQKHLSNSFFADLAETTTVARVINDVQPEIVFHFAAQSLVRRAFRNPRETFSANTMGTVNLLDGLRGCGSLLCILVTTTDKIYLSLEKGLAFREDDPLGGVEP